jgi:lipid A 3-O-deacylase PagL
MASSLCGVGSFPALCRMLSVSVLFAAISSVVAAEEVTEAAENGDAASVVKTKTQVETPSEDDSTAASAEKGTASDKTEPLPDSEEEDRYFRFFDGHWRVELSGATDLPTGSFGNPGDALGFLSVEYEFPVMPYGTLGLRGIPLLYYGQNGYDDVIGAGLGITARLYHLKNEYRGFFLEGEGHILFHIERFQSNASNINFLTGVGAGYKFKNNWHVVLKYEHVSNAGLASRNAGVDTFGLGIGRSFKCRGAKRR